MSKNRRNKSKSIRCNFFNRPSGCRNGDTCRFSHSSSSDQTNSAVVFLPSPRRVDVEVDSEIQRKLTECLELSNNLPVAVLERFRKRQLDLQAVGTRANRKSNSAEIRNRIVSQHQCAMQEIISLATKADTKLTREIIMKIHQVLMEGLVDTAGVFRKGAIKVGKVKHRFPSPAQVGACIDRMVATYNKMETTGLYSPFGRAAWLAMTFMNIHPFSDGNGRMGRLLSNFALHRQCTPWEKFPIKPLLFSISFVNSEVQRKVYIQEIIKLQTSFSFGDEQNSDVRQISLLILNVVHHCYRVLGGMISADLLGGDFLSEEVKVEEVPAEKHCIICIEDNVHVNTACCKQSFHILCLQRWVLMNPSCPSCRAKIDHKGSDIEPSPAPNDVDTIISGNSSYLDTDTSSSVLDTDEIGDDTETLSTEVDLNEDSQSLADFDTGDTSDLSTELNTMEELPTEYNTSEELSTEFNSSEESDLSTIDPELENLLNYVQAMTQPPNMILEHLRRWARHH